MSCQSPLGVGMQMGCRNVRLHRACMQLVASPGATARHVLVVDHAGHLLLLRRQES